LGKDLAAERGAVCPRLLRHLDIVGHAAA
jgi:hypothetical protein